LLREGVTVKESRGRLSYLTPDRTKPVTARKLGDDFDRAAVLKTLTQNAQNAARAAEKPLPKQEYPRSLKDRLQRNKAAINAPKNDSVQRMVDREAKRAEGKGAGYDRWAAVHNLKQMAATMSIYEKSGFSSPEELKAALTAASAELNSVHAELKAVESTLREKKDLQKQLLAYIKTKPARDGLKAQKTEKARRAYREQHESDFIIAEAATRYFKAQGISKLPASKALQAEIEQLTREKNALYNEYREKRERTTQLQTVKNNIEQILRREPERGKGKDHER
ncbi:TPA: relaxase, partial [Clostridioides difficile]